MRKLILLLVVVLALCSCKGLRSAKKSEENRYPTEFVNFSPIV